MRRNGAGWRLRRHESRYEQKSDSHRHGNDRHSKNKMFASHRFPPYLGVKNQPPSQNS
jgi:hypothetical protein